MLDGIIDFLPIKKNHKIINSQYCIQRLTENYAEHFYPFPRIQQVFSVKADYDFDLIYTNDPDKMVQRLKVRKKLIDELIRNNNNFTSYGY